MDYCDLMRIRRRRHHYNSGSGNGDLISAILFLFGFLMLSGAIKNQSWLFNLPLISKLDGNVERTVLRVVFGVIGVLLVIAGVVRSVKVSSS